MLCSSIAGMSMKQLLNPNSQSSLPQSVQNIALGSWKYKTRSELDSSSYVIGTLESAIWCFAEHESFIESVLTAVNLGNDADTVGAVTGKLAGAYYGTSGFRRNGFQFSADVETSSKSHLFYSTGRLLR